jgi:hypothetical protein
VQRAVGTGEEDPAVGVGVHERPVVPAAARGVPVEVELAAERVVQVLIGIEVVVLVVEAGAVQTCDDGACAPRPATSTGTRARC